MKINPFAFYLLLSCFAIPMIAHAQTPADSEAIMEAQHNWEKGWNEGDVALATQDYADTIDWTNAFGTRVEGKDNLIAEPPRFFRRLFYVSTASSN